MISAGSYDKRISIDRRSDGVDGLGQPSHSWVLVAELWARILYPSGAAMIKSGADVSIVKASVRIRYRVGVEPGMRVRAGSEAFDIVAVLPNKAKGYADLVCVLLQ